MGGAGEKGSIAFGRDTGRCHSDRAKPEDPNAHFKTTGPEIWEDTEGEVDIVVAAVGTGGTLTGLSEYLRKRIRMWSSLEWSRQAARCFPVENQEPHKIQGIGGGDDCSGNNSRNYLMKLLL